MKLCILDNDILQAALAKTYTSFGAMFERFLDGADAGWTYEVFNTMQGQYPASFDDFDAVLLTGSESDSFSDEAWVVELRRRVTQLLAERKKLIGVCFGHQLIGLCLGAPVGRAPQGWGEGRQHYDWHRPDLPYCAGRSDIHLLASHQDQVLALPPGATLLASSSFCPVAAFTVDQHVLCVQAHPEFDAGFSHHLLEEHRERLGEPLYQAKVQALALGHDGAHMARLVVAFVEGGPRGG